MSLTNTTVDDVPVVDIRPSGFVTHPFVLDIDLPLMNGALMDSIQLHAKSLEVLRDLGAKINGLANALILAQKHQPKGD